jgi:hypothetical protein
LLVLLVLAAGAAPAVVIDLTKIDRSIAKYLFSEEHSYE